MIEIEVKSLRGEVRSVVNARKLHALLEVKRKFADWIKDKLKNYTEGDHYVMIPFRNENNGKVSVSKEYYILLDIAKEIAKGRTALVDYLTECQEKYEPERYEQKALLDADLKVLEDGSVNARDLHRFLEVGTRFNDWIARRIENFGFRDGKDYYSYLSKEKGNEYSLSLSMAKELCMVENNEKGKAARLYFLECEEKLQKKEEEFSAKDRHMLDVIYAKSKEETILALQSLNQEVIEPLEQRVDELDEELRKMRLQRGIALYELVQQHHKSFYYDLILNTPDMFTVTEIAADYGLSAKDLNKILEEEKIQYKKGGRWFLYTKYSKLGLAKAKTYLCTCDKYVHHSVQGLKWTQKGRLFIYDLLKKREILPIGRFHNKIQHWNLEVNNPVYTPARLAASIAWSSAGEAR